MTRETTYKGSTGNAFTMRGTIDWSPFKKSADSTAKGEKAAKLGAGRKLTALMGQQVKISRFKDGD